MGLLTAVSALAWNETGHRAIALLAFEHLEPGVREEVAALLARHPHAETLLREGLIPRQVDPARIFANSAAWPDKVRKAPYASAYHRASWHYVNIPYVPDEYAAQFPPAAFTETGDLIRALEFNLTVLGNPKNAHEERAIALCWVAHLVGDIHQPLHAVALFTPRTPHGDKGGNALWVRKTPTAKSVTNIHSIWDAVLGGGLSFRSVEVIASRIRVACPVSIAPPGVIENTTPRSWADESVATAKIHVYRMGGLPLAVAETSKKPKPEEAPALPDGYIVDAREVADIRAAQAAYRLAAVLNARLGLNGNTR